MSNRTYSLPPMLRASSFSSPHALVEGNVYTVARVEFGDTEMGYDFPKIPRAPLPPSHSNLLPNFDLNWIPNEHPFMFLIPKFPPFQGPLFERLSVSLRNVPVRRIERDCYTLEPSLQIEWVSLERNLRAIAFAMVTICPVPLPKMFYFWAFPKRYGYELYYKTKESVQVRAIRSRDAFMPLIAAITFLLIILNNQEASGVGFTWHERVLGQTGIHYQWLSMLEESPVGDLSVPRVGGIINMETCEYKHLIPLLAKARLNMYLCWGDIEDAPLRPLKWLQEHNLVPDHQIIKQLHYLAKHPPPKPQTLVAPVSKGPVFPPVQPSSGQRTGESWVAFFARRHEANQERIAYETPQQLQSRLSKEKYASRHMPPGRKGATVFRWDDVHGFRIRTAVTRSAAEDFWTYYSNAQHKYDAFRDEWDICTEFGEGDPVDSDGEEYGSFWLHGTAAKQASAAHSKEQDEGLPPMHARDDNSFDLLPDDEHEQNHQEGDYSSKADLRRVFDDYDIVLQEDDVPFDQPMLLLTSPEPYEDTIYFRFGHSPLAPVDPPTRVISWDLASKILGNGRWADNLPVPSQRDQTNICTFLGHHWTATISSFPDQILDVLQDTSDLWTRNKQLDVRLETFDGTLYYFLRAWHFQGAAPMELALTSAATLLEIVRRDLGPGLEHAIEYLVTRGFTFNTFIRDDQRQYHAPDNVNNRYTGLGYRPLSYSPDAIDYQAYVSTRNRFLRLSRCRAAIMAGGLVARIARDVVSYFEVLAGPSDAVFEEGLCLWNGNASPKYWDDSLTEDELDKICGVYKVATGQYESGSPQTTDLSWWPKPSIWKKSGLGIGCWSADCERWYQVRLQDCVAGTAQLKKPSEWRHSLRFSKEVSRAVEKNEVLAAQAFTYLRSHHIF